MKSVKISGIVFLVCLWIMSAYGKGQSSSSNSNPGTVKEKVIFVELGSVNCIPCKMMQSVMKQIEQDYAGAVKVIFYDVWTAKDKSKASEYRIKAIPTQVFLDANGKEFFRHLGYFPAEEIEKVLAKQGIMKINTGKTKKE